MVVHLMAKSPVEDDSRGGGDGDAAGVARHPYDFLVSGPRNLSSPNWRDLIRSSWRDPNYKRTVIACFIQAAYLLELDRQEKRTEENGLAPNWWKPFKYKLTRTLIDERDGSIYGAVLEWDRSAAMADLVPVRPRGAPKAVLALRGTLLKSHTIWRDLQDDLRFLSRESLKGSVRFAGALEALQSAVARFGSTNVCIGGHSLGAGFALQIGKASAMQGVFVDCHLFNPPSVSLAMSLRIIGEKASSVLRRKKVVARSGEVAAATEEEAKASETDGSSAEAKRWVPNLYVNNSDYICCYYNHTAGVCADGSPDAVKLSPHNGVVAAKLFVASKGPQRFLEAHGLQQWWSDDMELQLTLSHSKLIDRQLRSLYAVSQPHPSLKS
ncbi:hypothetical protein OPV22_020277 [Ensete ventricosum]|uniref:Fungal lipase-like domain-containing protein n=1 Tax=Ensete ventricosum TaxID=4639 RepID=A0AAV8QG10_ENSVE|nr:hypothetical protein OPV22_020277 [Ensete ventricosum]